MSLWKFQNFFHLVPSSQIKYLDTGTGCLESWVTEQDGARQGCESSKEQGCAPDSVGLQRQHDRCIEESDLDLEKT